MKNLRVLSDTKAPLAEMTSHLRRLQNFSITQELRDLTGVDACVRWSARQNPAVEEFTSTILAEWATTLAQQAAAGVPGVFQRFSKMRTDLVFAELARNRLSARLG
jgi:hypothetical protein